MREILFRGKRENDDVWVYGIPYENYIIREICWDNEFPEALLYPVHFGTIGQFTGLTDKNGTKIFEGDILKFYNGEEFSNYEVIWFGNAYKVLMEGETEIQDDLDLFFCEHSEVIGNIHDNPELLEVNNE